MWFQNNFVFYSFIYLFSCSEDIQFLILKSQLALSSTPTTLLLLTLSLSFFQLTRSVRLPVAPEHLVCSTCVTYCTMFRQWSSDAFHFASYNHFHNILRIFDVLPNFHHKWNDARILLINMVHTSWVTEWPKT